MADEKPKHYGTHVAKGKAQGVEYTSGVPQGVDKDKDGELDARRGRRRN